MNIMVSPVNLVLNWMYNGSQEPYGLEILGKKRKEKDRKIENLWKTEKKDIFVLSSFIYQLSIYLVPEAIFYFILIFFNSKNHTYGWCLTQKSLKKKKEKKNKAICSNFFSCFVWVDGLG